MSYITRTGNLAETPTLREGENGPYTYARVLVSDRVQDAQGEWTDGPVVGYDVAVSGNQAVNLVEAASTSGNIRITFSGTYKVTQFTGPSGTRLDHNVRADEIGVSLRGQRVIVDRTPADSED